MRVAEHHAAVAGAFSDRVDRVLDWEAPAPVQGWVARDVVSHLVEWLPGFLAGGGVQLHPDGERTPGERRDPATVWHQHVAALQTLLEAPDAGRPFSHPQIGALPLDRAVDQFYVTDVFLHTWDLSRAAGLDDRLDPEVCAQLLAGMEPLDELLRSSGQYGPRVPVPDDAPAQDRLMAFIGRDPAWRP
jgi:uncharacterized protein (TIGR03086 family)